MTRPRAPVLLVPGWSDRGRVLDPIRRYLIGAGWPSANVEVLDFRDRFGSNVEHANELVEAACALASRVGAVQVDVVAHSMGGLASRYALIHDQRAAAIRRVVCLGTPHLGTWVARLGWGGAAREMHVGSNFITELNRDSSHAVRVAAIHTPLDLRVFPGSNARLPGAANVQVWCAGHRSLLRSTRVHQMIIRLLEASDVGNPV